MTQIVGEQRLDITNLDWLIIVLSFDLNYDYTPAGTDRLNASETKFVAE